MDRRQAMLGLAAMFGAELVLPLRRAIAAGIDPVAMTGVEFFTADMRDDVVALAEVIIPTTDTPGAREAGVGDFIEFMLHEFYPDGDRERFVAGMNALAAHCESDCDRPFAALEADAQAAVVARLADGNAPGFDDGGRGLFEHAKQLTIFGYYTSEIGMTLERHYLPWPGRFDGAYPYEKVGTLFTP